MRSIKKILMGIAVILFGCAISASNISNEISFVGWGISLLGLIISAHGFWFTSDN